MGIHVSETWGPSVWRDLGALSLARPGGPQFGGTWGPSVWQDLGGHRFRETWGPAVWRDLGAFRLARPGDPQFGKTWDGLQFGGTLGSFNLRTPGVPQFGDIWGLSSWGHMEASSFVAPEGFRLGVLRGVGLGRPWNDLAWEAWRRLV